MMSGCSRPLAVVAEPGRQAATYTCRKEQAIRIVILKTGMLSQALSLKPTHPPQPHILPKVTCAAHTEKFLMFTLCPRLPKSRQSGMNKGAFVVALVCLLLISPFVRKGPREAEYLSYSQQALAGAPLPLRGGGDQGVGITS